MLNPKTFCRVQETMNPKDIMTDAIHNFHPQYQQYSELNLRLNFLLHQPKILFHSLASSSVQFW